MSEKSFGIYIPKSVEYKHRKYCTDFLSIGFIVLAVLYVFIAMSIHGSIMENIHTRNFVLLMSAGLFFQIMGLYFNAMQFKHLEHEMKKQKPQKQADT